MHLYWTACFFNTSLLSDKKSGLDHLSERDKNRRRESVWRHLTAWFWPPSTAWTAIQLLALHTVAGLLEGGSIQLNGLCWAGGSTGDWFIATCKYVTGNTRILIYNHLLNHIKTGCEIYITETLPIKGTLVVPKCCCIFYILLWINSTYEWTLICYCAGDILVLGVTNGQLPKRSQLSTHIWNQMLRCAQSYSMFSD